MNANPLERMLSTKQDQGKKVFIPYIMAGDGGLDALIERVKLLQDAGASAVELGIPFSDPAADGPVIQKAGMRALASGTTLAGIFTRLKDSKGQVKIPLILMAYTNSILSYGLNRFAADCAEAGISGCIVPDLPYEEEKMLSRILNPQKTVLIRLVTLTSPEARLETLTQGARGFIYAVTVNGITGTREGFGENIGSYLKKVKEMSPVPVLAGFGISTPEQVREVSAYCDGVISGSRIIEYFEEGDESGLRELIGSAAQAVH